MIPPKEELEYFLDEIMRDAKTQREALTRLGRLYRDDNQWGFVQWQKAKRWLQVLDIPVPFSETPCCHT